MSGTAAPGSASTFPGGDEAASAAVSPRSEPGAWLAPDDSATTLGAALQQAHWRSLRGLSSGVEMIEHFVERAGFDRAPWLAVAFGGGIAAWFGLPGPWAWLALLGGAGGVMVGALAAMRPDGRYPYLRQALASLALALAAGCGTVWAKSELVGMAPIARPVSGTFSGMVISRQEQPAEGRSRLIAAIRNPLIPARIIQVRINVPLEHDTAAAREGALIRFRARLMPPAPPMLPGAYDFARAAWFQRLAATGSVLGPVEVQNPGVSGTLDPLRRSLSAHVRERLSGSPGGIAAAFASGDRGGIAAADEEAMRDSGLTHLLSVSGLHVSAVIGAAYLLAIRLLALWPWLALRVRLPILSAGIAAFTGLFYTLLTGSEVPTVRSVAGAMLVLIAISLGREALSLRLLAVAGFAVMLVWPEAVVGPSFQLSFAAVMTIIALHASPALRAFSARRQEAPVIKAGRHLAVLLLTGVAIELALMPIVLFHFHRAGIYGSLANVVAIPLTTFITMPLIALGLFLDLFGAGAAAWWGAGKSLELLLALAHLVAGQPGAVTMFPTMGNVPFALFIGGGLWLALWQARVRYWGLLPIAAGTVWLATLRAPDVLVSGDGHHVAFTGLVPDTMVLLRDSRSTYARENLAENAGMDGRSIPLEQWPAARCNEDFCALEIARGGRSWRFLLARGHEVVPLRDLAAACERADVVIADRRLPLSCRPAVLKADRALLDRTGGITLNLESGEVRTVAESQGDHGWWSPRIRKAGFTSPIAAPRTGPATATAANGASPPATRPD